MTRATWLSINCPWLLGNRHRTTATHPCQLPDLSQINHATLISYNLIILSFNFFHLSWCWDCSYNKRGTLAETRFMKLIHIFLSSSTDWPNFGFSPKFSVSKGPSISREKLRRPQGTMMGAVVLLTTLKDIIMGDCTMTWFEILFLRYLVGYLMFQELMEWEKRMRCF